MSSCAQLEVCPSDEDIVRMIHKASWDARHKRLTLSFFKEEPNNSVSRLKIKTLPELYSIFRKYKGWDKNLVGSGSINIAMFQEIADPETITVVPNESASNKAHAIILEVVSMSTTDRLVKSGKLAIHIL